MDRIATFGERLAAFRAIKDMTLEQLSDATGVPPQTLNRYELGQRVPKIDVANDIAEKIYVNPLWLQGFDVPMESSIPEILGAAAHFDLGALPPEAIKQYNEFIELLAYKYRDK